MICDVTLDELEKAYLQVKAFAAALLEFPNDERVRALQSKCSYYAKIRGRFGNVAEQFGRVRDAAGVYKKATIDRAKADANLHQALERARMAIRIHRRFPQSI